MPLSPKKIVLLGMITRIPVAGEIWSTLHYMIGFERLGYEVYYVEAHARTPTMLMDRADEDGSDKAAAFIDKVMRRFDLGGRDHQPARRHGHFARTFGDRPARLPGDRSGGTADRAASTEAGDDRFSE